ncbi:hypothetical protein KSZ_74610 [Dictyobacter formicarum]|uniref:PilZ domain-containing protein n=1 Tax=Dictyobacter formicarum TaxID=2778368 RepID=A0ABQ3VTA7_9CHLR|nr:hypothetical protein KSZ_74610 [Dictyobacter formicarum]
MEAASRFTVYLPASVEADEAGTRLALTRCHATPLGGTVSNRGGFGLRSPHRQGDLALTFAHDQLQAADGNREKRVSPSLWVRQIRLTVAHCSFVYQVDNTKALYERQYCLMEAYAMGARLEIG